MTKLPRISESEWLVMRVLWSESPLAANEVFEELDGKTKWKRCSKIQKGWQAIYVLSRS
jgi:predicted transcriptional regulator